MKFVSRKMVVRFEESSKDGVALRRLFQSHALEMAVKNLLGFPHHLLRKHRLVVDAILQHKAGTEGQNIIGGY
jgi:hypothetical protein